MQYVYTRIALKMFSSTPYVAKRTGIKSGCQYLVYQFLLLIWMMTLNKAQFKSSHKLKSGNVASDIHGSSKFFYEKNK